MVGYILCLQWDREGNRRVQKLLKVGQGGGAKIGAREGNGMDHQ